MSAIGQYFRNIVDGVGTTIAGMRVTAKYLRSPETTIQYPTERMPMFDRFRGLLHNRIEDCIGCGQCVRACPVDCITMVTLKAGKAEDLGQTRDGQAKKLHVYQFDIDTLKCMWCNLCTEVCPTECLTMSPEYEVSSYGRKDWVLRFAIESAPDDFDMDDWRYKQNRATNPVDYAGDADPQNLVIPEDSTRPTCGAGVYDFDNDRKAALAEAAAAKKAAAMAAADAKKAAAEAAKPAAETKPPDSPEKES